MVSQSTLGINTHSNKPYAPSEAGDCDLEIPSLFYCLPRRRTRARTPLFHGLDLAQCVDSIKISSLPVFLDLAPSVTMPIGNMIPPQLIDLNCLRLHAKTCMLWWRELLPPRSMANTVTSGNKFIDLGIVVECEHARSKIAAHSIIMIALVSCCLHNFNGTHSLPQAHTRMLTAVLLFPTLL